MMLTSIMMHALMRGSWPSTFGAGPTSVMLANASITLVVLHVADDPSTRCVDAYCFSGSRCSSMHPS